MSSGTPEMPDLSGLLQQAAEMQQRLTSTQHELQTTRVEGSAGGGVVQATVSGSGDLLGITIDPDVCDPEDTETLADLVVAAVRNATTKARQIAEAKLGQAAGPMAGLDMESLGESLSGLLGGGPPAPPPEAAASDDESGG